MGQKVPQLDGARQISGCAPDHKAWQQFAQQRLQFELPALDQKHGRSCSCYNLSQAGHVIYSVGGHGRRAFFISESPQSPLEHNVITRQDAEGATRKGPRRNGVFQDPEGSGKPAGFFEGLLSNWGFLRGHGFLVG